MEVENISTIHNEELIPNNNPKEIVEERLTRHPNNSIVWAMCNFFERRENEEGCVDILWPISKILNEKSDNQKKCKFTKDFAALSDGNYYLECLLCSERKKYYPKSPSAPEMFTHILLKHEEFLKEYKKKEKSRYCSYTNNRDSDVHKSHILLAATIISSHSPFNILENTYFKQFVNQLNQDYILPSRSTMSGTIIEDMYENVKKEIKKEIAEAPGLCFTIDGWTCKYV